MKAILLKSSTNRASFIIKRMYKTLVFLFLVIPQITLQAQTQEVIFPDLSGDELLEAIQSQYTPSFVPTYGSSRDSLFGRIDQVNDSLRCVYTGYKVYLDPTEDPTIAAYMNGAGINTEHTYPQSKGASEEPARANMHHLFPTRVDVNQVRGSFAFADIPDENTESWYYLDQFRNSTPTSNIDAYSEFRNGAFEPPEAHKGNIARAMFYFYTIYRSEAQAADPNFFSSQMETLCRWHYQDPVDEEEWSRTWKIAEYQDGKANPFVLDCSLTSRLYCQNTAGTCLSDLSDSPSQQPEVLIGNAYPNPFNREITIPLQLQTAAQVSYNLYNGIGQVYSSNSTDRLSAGGHQIIINPSDYPGLQTGIWWVRLEIAQADSTSVHWVRMIYQP